MRKLISILCGLVVVTAAFAGTTPPAIPLAADVAPVTGPVNTDPIIDAQWDILLDINAGIICADNQLLGCEFAFGQFYITGGNNATNPNKLYILDATGTLIATVDQPTTSSWGWRDPAYDGTYIYAGDDNTVIHAFDATGTIVPSMNIPRPAGATVTRALAYDPATDHFWTANFGANIIEFTRTGAVIWSGPPPAGWTALYGAAWDAVAPGGPFLWFFDQTGTPQTTIRQYNPITHTATGVNYVLPLLSGSSAQIAGGISGLTDEYNPALWTMHGITQGTPDDRLFVVEMYPTGPPLPNIYIAMAPANPPIYIPLGGGRFDFLITITNNEYTSQTFEIWIMATLPTGLPYGPVLGPIELTLPGRASLTRLRTQIVPGSAPPGEYGYTGYVGDFPDMVYSFSPIAFGIGLPGSYIEVNDPNSNSVWVIGTEERIEYESFGIIGWMKVTLSLNGGKTFPTIIADWQPTNNVIWWTVPDNLQPSEDCIVRVSTTNWIQGLLFDDSEVFNLVEVNRISNSESSKASLLNKTPNEFALLSSSPNPFNPSTTISFAIPEAARVTLNVYDVSGRMVSSLVNGWRDAGVHEVTFDGSNLTSGIYFYRLKADNNTATGKMVLVK